MYIKYETTPFKNLGKINISCEPDLEKEYVGGGLHGVVRDPGL